MAGQLGATFAALLDAAQQAKATAPQVGNSSQLSSETTHAQAHGAQHPGCARGSAPEQISWYPAALSKGRMHVPPKSAKAILPQRWALGQKPPEYLTAVPDDQLAPGGRYPLKFNIRTHHNWRMETVGDSFAALGKALAAQLPGQHAELPDGTKLAVAAGQPEGHVRVKLLRPMGPAATQAAAPQSAALQSAATLAAAPQAAVPQSAAMQAAATLAAAASGVTAVQTAQSAGLAGSPPTGTLAGDGVQAAQRGDDSDEGSAPSDISQEFRRGLPIDGWMAAYGLVDIQDPHAAAMPRASLSQQCQTGGRGGRRRRVSDQEAAATPITAPPAEANCVSSPRHAPGHSQRARSPASVASAADPPAIYLAVRNPQALRLSKRLLRTLFRAPSWPRQLSLVVPGAPAPLSVTTESEGSGRLLPQNGWRAAAAALAAQAGAPLLQGSVVHLSRPPGSRPAELHIRLVAGDELTAGVRAEEDHVASHAWTAVTKYDFYASPGSAAGSAKRGAAAALGPEPEAAPAAKRRRSVSGLPASPPGPQLDAGSIPGSRTPAPVPQLAAQNTVAATGIPVHTAISSGAAQPPEAAAHAATMEGVTTGRTHALTPQPAAQLSVAAAISVPVHIVTSAGAAQAHEAAPRAAATGRTSLSHIIQAPPPQPAAQQSASAGSVPVPTTIPTGAAQPHVAAAPPPADGMSIGRTQALTQFASLVLRRMLTA